MLRGLYVNDPQPDLDNASGGDNDQKNYTHNFIKLIQPFEC